MIPVTLDTASTPSPSADARGVLLWVDGGGVFLVCLRNELKIGRQGGGADLPFMAPIASTHAVVFRTGESHVIVPQHPLSVSGKPLTEPTLLRDGQLIEIFQDLCLKFRTPSPLSRTAVLSFPGKISPTPTLDAAILMTQTCLIGPDPQSHIVVPGVEERAILLWNGHDLTCRFTLDLGQNGNDSFWGDPQTVIHDSLISGRQIRFRCESFPA